MGDVKQYRTEPTEVDAWQWTEESEAHAIEVWAGAEYDPDLPGATGPDGEDGGELTIETPAGTLTVAPFDYVVRGIGDVFYPCPPGVFTKTHKEIQR